MVFFGISIYVWYRVAAGLMPALPNAGVDFRLGIGGTPEGVIAACALRGMGGEMQGKLYARDEAELNRGRDAGYDFDKVLTMDDLVSSEDVFFAATGITDGELLKGALREQSAGDAQPVRQYQGQGDPKCIQPQ